MSTDGRTDRRTDKHQGESSIPPFHLRWSGGIKRWQTETQTDAFPSSNKLGLRAELKSHQNVFPHIVPSKFQETCAIRQQTITWVNGGKFYNALLRLQGIASQYDLKKSLIQDVAAHILTCFVISFQYFGKEVWTTPFNSVHINLPAIPVNII